jgi:hypothetical protein
MSSILGIFRRVLEGVAVDQFARLGLPEIPNCDCLNCHPFSGEAKPSSCVFCRIVAAKKYQFGAVSDLAILQQKLTRTLKEGFKPSLTREKPSFIESIHDDWHSARVESIEGVIAL